MSLRPEVSRQLKQEAERQAAEKGQRGWKVVGTKKGRPLRRFLYTTQAIVVDGERGWASFVVEETGGASAWRAVEVIEDSFILHRRRKDARARAYALWQGYRVGLGLDPGWRDWRGAM